MLKFIWGLFVMGALIAMSILVFQFGLMAIFMAIGGIMAGIDWCKRQFTAS